MLFIVRCLAIILIGVSGFLLSCTHTKEFTGNQVHKYSLFIMTDNGDTYLMQTSSLDSGSMDPEKDGVLMRAEELEREMIVKNGFYYSMNSKKALLSKHSIQGGVLKKIDSVHISGFYVSNYNWIHSDTLLLIGVNEEDTKVVYAKISVNDMKVERSVLDIKVPYGSYNSITIGLSYLKDSTFFVGYTYHISGNDHYITSDTSYVATFRYPDMKILTVLKDDRSTYPGSENLIEPASFTDDKNDFYYLTCPGVALGNNPAKPTAICRINHSSNRIDSSYFFNISTSAIQNHAYSMYYIGDGKAIIRSERKDLFKSWNEHWKVPHFEFYIIDLESQEIQKLTLPLDKGTRRQCVINEDHLVYISLSSDKEGDTVWIYNKKDGSLRKGLSFTGKTSYILRMDTLY